MTGWTDNSMLISVPAYPFQHFSTLSFEISSVSYPSLPSVEAAHIIVVDTCNQITEITMNPIQVSVAVDQIADVELSMASSAILLD